MYAEIQHLMVRRLNKVFLPAFGGKVGASSARSLAAAVTNMWELGYIPNSLLWDKLSQLSPEGLAELLKVMQDIRGVSDYSPMYPNFPAQVASASDVELLLNAILHYVGDVIGERIMPTYRKLARPDLPDEDRNVIALGVADEWDAAKLFSSLVTQNQPFSEQDKEDILSLHNTFSSLPIPNPGDEQIKIKENLVWLTTQLPNVSWGGFQTATDVLRLAAAYSGGDITLAENTRFKLSRPQRRKIMDLLHNISLTSKGSLNFEENEEKWKRLARTLHHREFSPKYSEVSHMLSEVQAGKVPTFNSRVETALANEKYATAVGLLTTRPGLFARRLAEILRKAPRVQRRGILKNFSTVVDKVSLPTLIQMWGHFNGPSAADMPQQIVQVKARRQKTMLIPNRRSGEYSDVLEVIERGIQAQGAGKKIWFSDNPDGVVVPLAIRTLSKGMNSTARGTRTPLREGGTLRTFMFWKDSPEYGRTDLDLSMLLVSEDFITTHPIAYYSLRGGQWGWHSGDITSAPEGAAEFIDLDIAKALNSGYRYAIPSVLNYTRFNLSEVPEARAGFMMRSKPNSGEIFEPSTVTDSYALGTEAPSSVPCVFDLQAREMIWWDSTIKVDTREVYNVASNQNTFLFTLETLVKSRQMTVTELASLVGTVVDSEEEADVVVNPRQIDSCMTLIS